ncbi:MAG: hypothetical protein IJ119_08260 [Clostridia bacterium]|nr:hypothetical protein [Clostridia bacterium]
MMKKLFVVILAVALLLCAAALAEETKAKVKGEIVDGSYVIRIPDENGDLGWLADDMAQDDSVVKLAKAGLEGNEFVIQYDPTGDGEVSVGARHYIGIACNEYLTWDLSVKDGKVTEVTGGSYTASPDPETFDPYLVGEYESADGMAGMTVAKNEGGRAWDVDMSGALTQGGYVFKTTIYYDCELDRFVYDKGKTWNVEITESGEAPELGEATIAGQTGAFFFTGNPADMILTWQRDEDSENTVDFQRKDAPVAIDLGQSGLYLKEELLEGMDLIRTQIAGWEGVELHSICYAGDENCTEENLAWLNEHESAEGKTYTQCALFQTNFHTPAESSKLALDLDFEYEDYGWWLAREDGGSWALVDAGY